MDKPAEPAVGIDLGTTYSVVATLDADHKPRTLPSGEGELTTPSVVFFDRSGPIVGREALQAAEFEPHRAAYFAKRDMGQSEYRKPILGRKFPPEVIQALILQKLKADAAERLGEFTKAVVTVPAYFNEPRRKATQDAGRLAGLDVIDILNEPTAAAIAYGVEHGFVTPAGSTERRELVLVYDLGGGTFDVTLMNLHDRRFEAVATAGDVYLGGVDWDERIARHLADAFQREHNVSLDEEPNARERLSHVACAAKHALTAREETPLAFSHLGRSTRLKFTRQEFESLTADLLDRTRLTLRRLLKDAGVGWTDVTRLLITGGSTRMPMVQRMLMEESGRKPDRSLSPDEAVAHGAAIYAGLIMNQEHAVAGMSVRNVNSHDLGLLGIDPETRRPKRRIMIPRNSPIPAAVTRTFQTAKVGQKSVMVQVVEGGTDSGTNSTPIGRCVVSDLPPNLPAKTPVEVTFRYRPDGRLLVTATVSHASVQRQSQLVIERDSGLSEGAFAEWQAKLQAGLAMPDEPVAEESAPLDFADVEESAIEWSVDETAPPAEPAEEPEPPSLDDFLSRLR